MKKSLSVLLLTFLLVLLLRLVGVAYGFYVAKIIDNTFLIISFLRNYINNILRLDYITVFIIMSIDLYRNIFGK